MWRTNLKIGLIVLGTLGVYTGIANVIPQLESQVPKQVEVSATASTAELVSMGEEIYHGAGGCEACHGLGTRAPTLLGEIGRRCGDRRPEMGCKEYLHESLVEPQAFVVEGFQPIMPAMNDMLSGGQIWAVVAFLETQGGEVTVTSEDLAQASAGGGEEASPAEAPAAAPEEVTALVEQFGCLACHELGGRGGVTAPAFDSIRAARQPAAYVRRSIVDPNADTAGGWEQFAGTMPPNFQEQMSEEQIRTLVDFLSGGGAGSGSGAAGGGDASGAEGATGTGDAASPGARASGAEESGPGGAP